MTKHIEQSNEIIKLVEQSGLETETSVNIKEKFLPFFEQAKEWEKKAKALVVTSVDQKDEMRAARDARLTLKNIRVDADKTRKALKEDSLRYGKAVQGVYNVIEFLISPIEKHLEEQEKFAEREEEKRINNLRIERQEEAQPFYEFIPANLDFGFMSDGDYSKLLEGAKLQKAAQEKAKQEAEQERLRLLEVENRRWARSEELRPYFDFFPSDFGSVKLGEISDEEFALIKTDLHTKKVNHEQEQDRIRKQNDLLKKQKEEAEAKLEEERKKAEEVRAEEKRIQDAKLAKEQAENKRLEEELQQRKDKEEKERLERLKAEKKAKSAPDKVKLQSLKSTISGIEIPELTTPEAVEITNSIKILLGKVAAFIDEKCESL